MGILSLLTVPLALIAAVAAAPVADKICPLNTVSCPDRPGCFPEILGCDTDKIANVARVKRGEDSAEYWCDVNTNKCYINPLDYGWTHIIKRAEDSADYWCDVNTNKCYINPLDYGWTHIIKRADDSADKICPLNTVSCPDRPGCFPEILGCDADKIANVARVKRGEDSAEYWCDVNTNKCYINPLDYGWTHII